MNKNIKRINKDKIEKLKQLDVTGYSESGKFVNFYKSEDGIMTEVAQVVVSDYLDQLGGLSGFTVFKKEVNIFQKINEIPSNFFDWGKPGGSGQGQDGNKMQNDFESERDNENIEVKKETSKNNVEMVPLTGKDFYEESIKKPKPKSKKPKNRF